MSAEVLSKIHHDPKDPGLLGGVERCCGAPDSFMSRCNAKIGPGIPTERAGLYPVQAGAPSVYQKQHLCCGDRCLVADRPGRYARYRQAKRQHEVPSYSH